MKKPRVSDFDPNAAPELRSSMDSFPMIETPQKKKQSPPPPPSSDSSQDTLPSPTTSVVSRYHDTIASITTVPEEPIVETVRKSVKQVGKEAATHRCTLEEKEALTDIAYSYKKHGVRTSANELTRIAVNYMIQDYKTNGEKSFLSQILKKLNE